MLTNILVESGECTWVDTCLRTGNDKWIELLLANDAIL